MEDREVWRLNLELLRPQPSRKSGQWRKKKKEKKNLTPLGGDKIHKISEQLLSRGIIRIRSRCHYYGFIWLQSFAWLSKNADTRRNGFCLEWTYWYIFILCPGITDQLFFFSDIILNYYFFFVLNIQIFIQKEQSKFNKIAYKSSKNNNKKELDHSKNYHVYTRYSKWCTALKNQCIASVLLVNC